MHPNWNLGMTDMDVRMKYVCKERMANGKSRYRFQRYGKKTTINGEYGSPEFHAHYANLLDGVDRPQSVAIARMHKGSIAYAVGIFLIDLERRVAAGINSPLTLKGHKHHLGRLVEHYGRKPIDIPRRKVVELRDKFAHTPGAADNLMKSMSALYAWLAERDMTDTPEPTRGIKRLNRNSSGWVAWVKSDFKAYFKTHAKGTMARRALVLAISSTARRDDLIRLGRQNETVIDGRRWLKWTQGKAPHRIVEMPMTTELLSEVTGHNDLTYILTEKGVPFTHAGFGARFRKWCDDAELPTDRKLHGVRKGVSSLLPTVGATSLELDVLLGHELNSGETKTYVENANRMALAVTAIDRLDVIKW